MKILIVCLGNICRSPIAEGVLRTVCTQRNLPWTIDSAGTGNWHVGERPDMRAIKVCASHRIDIKPLRARQMTSQDFDVFDLILTMDASNHKNALALAQSEEHRNKVKPFTSFSKAQYTEVPDPYFDGRFEEVFAMIEEVCEEMVEALNA